SSPDSRRRRPSLRPPARGDASSNLTPGYVGHPSPLEALLERRVLGRATPCPGGSILDRCRGGVVTVRAQPSRDLVVVFGGRQRHEPRSVVRVAGRLLRRLLTSAVEARERVADFVHPLTLVGSDVVVVPEDVFRVVLALQLDQARVVRPVGAADRVV